MTMPETFTQTRHRCPFCRRSWASITRARRHIARCWKNPAARACKTCRHAVAYEHAGFIDTCAAGEELHIDDGSYEMRTMCPLWQAVAEAIEEGQL